MRTRNNIMILDTETVGTFGQPLIHDFGYVIIDKHYNILTKGRFLVKELHAQGKWILKTSDFFSQYTKDYEKARETEQVISWKEISKKVSALVREFKVTTISAYNLAFDYRAIKYTDEFFSENALSKILDRKKTALLCIFNLACETILDTDKYRQFCTDNGYISEKGNYRTGAEFAYRYITNNTEYIEKHTALADAEDEKVILEYICKNVSKETIKYGLHYNCWKKVQK